MGYYSPDPSKLKDDPKMGIWKKFIRKIVSTLQISLNQGLISPGISMLRAFIFFFIPKNINHDS